jgi:hypothetical protein
VVHGQRALLGGDSHFGFGHPVDVGVQRRQRGDQRVAILARSLVLVLPVNAPPLDLELRGPRRVKALRVAARD